MAMEKEALSHKIEDDLAARNRNWDKLTSHLADYATQMALKADKAWGNAIAATLQNGWEGTLSYRKHDDLGLVWLFGAISAGVITPGTIISTIPTGFRPTHFVSIPVYDSARGRSYEGIHLRNNGNLQIANPASELIGSDGTPRINVIYKV